MLIVVAIALTSGGGASILQPRQTVTITTHNNVTAEIYPTEQNAQNTSRLAALTQSGTVQLPKGNYTALSRETADYADFSVQFTVDNKPVAIDINPPYSTKKLASLTPSIRADITTVLVQNFPKINDLYTIEDGWLYNKGEWYATKLDYKNPDDPNLSSSLRVILHKENGAWKLATTPPDITISSPHYPDIPRDIISSINSH